MDGFDYSLLLHQVVFTLHSAFFLIKYSLYTNTTTHPNSQTHTQQLTRTQHQQHIVVVLVVSVVILVFRGCIGVVLTGFNRINLRFVIFLMHLRTRLFSSCIYAHARLSFGAWCVQLSSVYFLLRDMLRSDRTFFRSGFLELFFALTFCPLYFEAVLRT